jgi:hypothetical protein
LFAAAEVRDLSGQKILSGDEPATSPDQESSSSDKIVGRKSRVRRQEKQDLASASCSSLAWHVDFAAVQNQIDNPAAIAHVDLSLHESSREIANF